MASKTTHFTDGAVKDLPPGDWTDPRYPNLTLRVGKKARTWSYRPPRLEDGSRPGGSLGRFPELNTEAAIKKYKIESGRIARGEAHPDPQEEIRELEKRLKALKRATGKLTTFGDLADDFLEDYEPKSGRPWGESTRYNNTQLIRDYMMPLWRDRDVDSLEESEVKALLTYIRKTKPPTSLAVYKLLGQIYRWAVKKKKAQVNPVQGLNPPAETSKRDRVLSPEELRAAWNCFSEIKPIHGLALKMLVLTWQRRGEVAGTMWSELADDNWWELPRERTKTKKRMNLIYLGPVAHRVIELAKPHSEKSAFLFRGYTQQDQPIHKRYLTNLVTRISRHLVSQGICRLGFTVHDLRRFCATVGREKGIDKLTVKTLLNHGRDDVTDVYDLYEMKPEIRSAMETWNDYLADLLGLKPGEV